MFNVWKSIGLYSVVEKVQLAPKSAVLFPYERWPVFEYRCLLTWCCMPLVSVGL